MGRRRRFVSLLPCLVAMAAALGPVALRSAAASSALVAGGRSGGWVVERVRFETLPPSPGVASVAGVGSYRGAIEVVRSGGGLAVVNEVGFEDYLKGISEMPLSWPSAALEAQVIAARTYSLRAVQNSGATAARGVGAHICATEACQVYTGLTGEQRALAGRWVEAVDATQGQVLLSEGRPISAEYSSSNGGRSVAASASYLPSVDDPEDAMSPLHRWTSVMSLESVGAALGLEPGWRVLDISRFGSAVSLLVVGPDEGAEPENREIDANSFRASVNARVPAPVGLPSPLPSARYDLRAEGGQAVAEGRGYGHGRGMSQYGAYGKALKGWSATDILAAYYGGLTPTTLGSDEAPATIRVAVAFDLTEARVSVDRFSTVLDEAGNPLATAAFGEWTIVPAGGGLRVVPPPGQDQPVTLPAVAPVPGVVAANVAPSVQVDVSAPARLAASFELPDGQAGTVEPTVVDAGTRVVTLPPSPRGGIYKVNVEVDAGGGRVAAAPLTLKVAGPNRGHVSGIRWRPPAPR